MKKQFTEKDLVDFGNYLLSHKRKESIKKEVNKRKVHDCDIANFKSSTYKCIHDWKTNIYKQYQECKKCGKGHAL